MNILEIRKLAAEIVNNLSDKAIDKFAERVAEHIESKRNPPLWPQDKAAEYLGKTYNSLGQMCYRGHIQFHKVGGSKYFKKEDLDNWLLYNGKD